MFSGQYFNFNAVSSAEILDICLNSLSSGNVYNVPPICSICHISQFSICMCNGERVYTLCQI